VEPSLVKMLEVMGFPHDVSVCALAHTNNVVSQAVTVIHEHPEFLEPRMNQLKFKADPEALNQVFTQVDVVCILICCSFRNNSLMRLVKEE